MDRGVFVCFVFMALLGACTGNRDSNAGHDALVGVRVLCVDEAASVHRRTYSAEAEAERSVIVSAPFPGTMSCLPVSEGDKVVKDDVIAEVESETVRSSHEMSLASLRQAEDGYARLQKVYGSGGVPDVKMVEMETALAKARASAAASGKALESCRIKAPFDGTVSDVYCHQGEDLQLAAPVLKIVDERSVVIRFSVPETEISEISVGEHAVLDVPAIGKYGIRSSVTSKGVEAARLSHAYECTLKSEVPVDGLLPGMVCKVIMDSDILRGVVIPAEIIQRDGSGTYVWTVKDGKAVRTYVGIGGFAEKGVLVEKGLSRGDKVISEGFQKVSTGMKVRIISE